MTTAQMMKAEHIVSQARQQADQIVARAEEDARRMVAEAENRLRMHETATALVERRYRAIQAAIVRVHHTLAAESMRGAA